ncbi:hypothetical protein CCMA1212_010316 [Trichoderma ghanense]|uniref:Uncharacterized protein n=1 Tax=Trichoderma ghanense TaxID=65468 RepID=A0ABY2GPX1_9HYPO
MPSCEQSPHGAPQRATRDTSHTPSADMSPKAQNWLHALGSSICGRTEFLSFQVAVLSRTRFQATVLHLNPDSNSCCTHLEGRACLHKKVPSTVPSPVPWVLLSSTTPKVEYTWAGTKCTACCSALWQRFNGTQASGLVRCPTTPGAAAGRFSWLAFFLLELASLVNLKSSSTLAAVCIASHRIRIAKFPPSQASPRIRHLDEPSQASSSQSDLTGPPQPTIAAKVVERKKGPFALHYPPQRSIKQPAPRPRFPSHLPILIDLVVGTASAALSASIVLSAV